MRSALAASIAVNCSILFTELPLEERPAAARAAGFDAVEFWWPFDRPDPGPERLDRFARALERADVRLASVGFDHGDLAAGDRGLFASASRSDRLRRNIRAVVALGERTGCRCFVGLYGLPDGDPAEAEETAVRHYTEAARAVDAIGGEIVIEPMSGVPGYGIRSLDQAVAFLDRVRRTSGAGNLGVLADLFHLTLTESDVVASLRRHIGAIRYVQLADRPGRGAPGTGEQPLRLLLDLLERLGYSGPVGLEFMPSEQGTAADLARFHRWIAPTTPGGTQS